MSILSDTHQYDSLGDFLLLGMNNEDQQDTVLSLGTFDGLHEQHISHLKQASEWGRLIVGVASDDVVLYRKNKQPVNSDKSRMQIISDTCPFVDSIFIAHEQNATVPLYQIRPEIYARGPDYKCLNMDTIFDLEKFIVGAYGGEVKFTMGPELHTSQIIERTQQLPKETMKWLSDFKSKYPNAVGDIEGWIESASKLRSGIVGENIWDEYVYVTPIGRSTKDPIVTFSEVSREYMSGGSMAIHYHQAGVYGYGMNVGTTEAITKTRYIVHPFGQKVYSHVKSSKVGPIERWPFDQDILTVADYGHGLIDEEVATNISREVFISLMVQANSINWGFNTLIFKIPNSFPETVTSSCAPFPEVYSR